MYPLNTTAILVHYYMHKSGKKTNTEIFGVYKYFYSSKQIHARFRGFNPTIHFPKLTNMATKKQTDQVALVWWLSEK